MKEFAIIALDSDNEAFEIYVVALNISFDFDIHFIKKT